MFYRKFPARKSSGRINVFSILQTAAFFIMELQRFYGGNFVEKLYQSNDLFITVSPFYPICHAYLFLIDIKRSIKNISISYRSDPETKKLHVVPEEAELVKKIFETYLRFGSGKGTAKFLDLCGLKTPVKVSRKGIPHGGDEFTGMYIYRVLQNPLYLGLTKHYDKTYPGEHEAIIDKKTWDKVQELLAFNLTHSGKKDIRFSPLRD